MSRVVSEMAKRAGVSPHVMQAGIWLGIKRQVEGDLGGVADYVAAIRKMAEEYKELWVGIDNEANQLREVIRRLTPGMAKDALHQVRRTNILNVVQRNTEKRRAAKTAAAQATSAGIK